MIVMQGILWVIAILLIVVGVAGVLLPTLPGTPLVFAGILIAAWIDGFEKIGPWTLTLVGVLGLATLGVDWLAASLGTRRFGGTRWGLAGALVGLLVGALAFGPLGLVLGPVVGAILFELLGARRPGGQALRAGMGAFIGFLLGTAVKYLLVLAMLAVAVFAWLS